VERHFIVIPFLKPGQLMYVKPLFAELCNKPLAESSGSQDYAHYKKDQYRRPTADVLCSKRGSFGH
jgi:hypothetical protein